MSSTEVNHAGGVDSVGELDGKVAIILGVGAKPNIGSGIATRFAAEGARVVVAGRDRAGIEKWAKQCGGHSIPCDITRVEDLTALARKTLELHGRVDIAVNAVGRNLVKNSAAVCEAEVRAILDVQLSGAFFFLQQMTGAMIHGGSIIQISSITAVAVAHDHALYMASKAGADMLVRSFAFDFGPQGVRVNSIAPGGTLDSPMAQHVMTNPEALTELRGRIPLRRVGTIADVADAAVWLAGDRCFMSGEVLQVNGGAAIHRLR